MGVGKDVLLLVLWHFLLLQADSKCPKSYTCRNFTLQFPFTDIDDPQCGLFTVSGCDSSSSRGKHPRLYIGAATSAKYILGQPSQNKLLILDFLLETLLESPKCYSFLNVSLPQSPSVSFTISPNITFFTCFNKTTNDQIQDYFQTYRRQECEASTLYYKTPATHDHSPEIPQECSLAQLPIKSDENSTELLHLLSPSFSLEWNVSEDCNQCYSRGGQCLADNQNDFYCKTEGTLLSSWLRILFRERGQCLSDNKNEIFCDLLKPGRLDYIFKAGHGSSIPVINTTCLYSA